MVGNFWVAVFIFFFRVFFSIFCVLVLYVHREAYGRCKGSWKLEYPSAYYTCSPNGKVLTLNPSKTR